MLDTPTPSHSCGCSTVPKKHRTVESQGKECSKIQELDSSPECGVWHCWRDTEPGEVSRPLITASNRNLEPWSNINTTPQRYHYHLALSLFKSLLFCCTALLAQKKIITIKELLSDSTDALIFEGCILAAQCRTLLTLLTQVGPKGFLTQSSKEWESTVCFGGAGFQDRDTLT